MTMPQYGDVDPIVDAAFRIGPDDKVATLGSCFAQHVARHIKRSGLNYFVPEDGGDLTAKESERRNYGVFSARYGNVYTVRQALQLFDRAFGDFVPQETAWQLAGDPAGRVVDPFRPQAEPGGFSSVEELEADRASHFEAVRRVFLESRVIVFTLGLTEGWRSNADGAVFPVAPGVSGGSFDARRYGFVNFNVDEVRCDLVSFCKRIRSINPSVKILLTVSPVALIATYEDRHVLVSTILSKSILRVAAEHATAELRYVSYFPSYELITAPGSPYFEPDLRQVSDIGVSHVMRIFERHYIAKPTAAVAGRISAATPTICDEEAIEHAMSAPAAGG
jgi:hypothetical protein